MARARTQRASSERGPLLALFVLFADGAAAAELFRMVRWHGGGFCPDCGLNNIAKYCLYQKHLQWYTCKDCNMTFNDKTGTILHYKHVSIVNWMAALWLFLCVPLNGTSIRFISQATGRAYKTTYYMIRNIMKKIRGLPEKPLKGTCEIDEAYFKVRSNGVPLDTNGGDRTVPSRRGLSYGPSRSTFEKNRPMSTIYFQRAAEDEPNHTIMYVPRDGKTLAYMVQERIVPGSTVMTDGHTGCRYVELNPRDDLSKYGLNIIQDIYKLWDIWNLPEAPRRWPPRQKRKGIRRSR